VSDADDPRSPEPGTSAGTGGPAGDHPPSLEPETAAGRGASTGGPADGDPLSPAAFEAVDPQGMLGDVLAQPLQLGDALWRAQSASIRSRDLPGGLVVCGMGGSAIGGDLAAAALGDRATRPVVTVRGYALESWTPPESLVLCASYSGETEETLACFDAAGAAGTRRVALTTGGRLAEAAREENVPVIGVPAGMQPRAAVLYMTVGALECAALCGAAPALHSEIDTATALLERLVEEWGPDAPADSLAKRVAGRLQGMVPVVHGAGPTAAVARRWRTQINENAKATAFGSELPEENHNEICGWERGRRAAPLAAVFLEDPDQHPRVRRRIDLTAEEVERTGAPAIHLQSRGDSRLERVLSLVLLGDLVSVYLAALDGVDPTPVEPIDRFKAALG
jgi:glucose/mannose-6-phosphate isomerase